ncbi:MAG: PLP-dependent aspartate aminotransferase family protein [Eubacterium sp.]|nr:PLP-dependent aspartate aminotransferase family protein [Eubacterium sp.]MDE6767669.1 PLP-dependent aspartate aminotransferase family protein [Eubacterium sp.]
MSDQLETRCIHGNRNSILEDKNYAISFPIYQTASFSHIKPGHNENGFDYTRESNPTRQRLENIITSLENAADTVAFSSGMAAITACFELFSTGDHIIMSDDLYGGTVRLSNLILKKNGLQIDYVDTTDLKNVENAIKPNTKAIYLETPSNPMMKITDIKACADLAHGNHSLLIVDNTFLSPYFQTPLSLGADIVIHSGSKFLSGHNDTISGFVSAKDLQIADKIRFIAKSVGNTLSPFDSWLVMRGVKTLAVRMEQQQKNAIKIAEWLEKQSKVTKVFYPGLKNHNGYETNMKQSRGYGSMISFQTDSEETAIKILESVKLIIFAESLGGTESLITYPILQTHPDVPVEVRERLGITKTLLRLSIGLENADDLIYDLKQAMEV